MVVSQVERDEIIRAAMLAVSVGGRTYPNRLRSLATHHATDIAINAADGVDREAEDREVLERALRRREGGDD